MLKKTCSDSYRRLLAPILSSSSSLSSTSRNRTEIELITRIINDHPFPNHPIQPIFTKHIPLSSLSPEFVSDVLGRLFAAHSNGLKALEFFKYSLKSSKSSPTSDSFEKTLDILARMRYFDQAWALMAEIRKDYPDLLSFKSMSILLCKIAKFGSYEETFVKMEKEIFRKKFGVDEFNILIREHMWQERGTCEEKAPVIRSMATDIFPSAPFSIAQVVTLKLTESNYLLWKTQIESFLAPQKLLGYVNGAIPRPPATVLVNNVESPNPEFTRWVQYDQLVLAWIFGSLSESALRVVYGMHSAHEVWSALAKKFNRVSTTRKYDLQKKLRSCLKSGKTMEEYVGEMKQVFDQLHSIDFPMTEQEKIYALLSGLGKEYEPVTTVIEHSMDTPPGPYYEDVVFKLIAFDDKQQSYSSAPEVTPHLVFHTEKSYYDKGGSNYRGGRSGNRGRGNYSTKGRGFQQHGNGQNSDSSRPTCQICGKYGHSAFKCYNRFNESYSQPSLPTAMAALRISDEEHRTGNDWLPDTAATAHITNSVNNLQQSQPYQGHDSVMVGNGDFLPITHIGTIPLQTLSGKPLPLNDVLVCPDVARNLLSVSKLCSDYPCSFKFDSDGVRVKDKQTKQLLTVGRRDKDLYVLENPAFTAFYSTRQHSTSDEVWHQRLGHPHAEILQHLSRTEAISVNKRTNKLCESCQLGKSAQLPFSSSTFVATKPLERLHCDLWGPAPVCSSQGFKYYVIFIDNFSRYCWFYPLKNKSDFYSVFLLFQTFVENQLNQKIKMFQWDGGGEFVSNQFVAHLAQCGIKQLISCPHTPQQNGLAERKHRHLTELGLSMLFHGKVPQQYWVEAFFTANYLSNLLPTTAHKPLKSPFEALFMQKPDYSALRTFGSACYPTLRAYGNNKFEPKSLKCVFIGYNDKYKGYRCVYPPTGRVYISRHVIFDEQVYPFAEDYAQFHAAAKTSILSSWQQGALPPLHTPNSVSQGNTESVEIPVSVIPPITNPHQEHPTNAEPAIPVPDATSPSTSNADTLFTDADFPPLPPPVVNEHSMVTRGKDGVRKPNPKYAMHTTPVIVKEPKTVASALKHPGWTAAMGEEIESFVDTKTFSLVPYQPDMNILGCRWVFRTKLNADGTLDKLRARLVAKGYDQEEGVDFLETFSPVVRTATVRLVLHAATVLNWEIKQLDVKNAFLHGDLSETVYMNQPPGFHDPENPAHVWKLHKAVYGLKQAPREWFNKFSTFLLQYGFECSLKDPSLFVYYRDNELIILLLYVDDMLLTGSSSELLAKLLQSLSTEFRMKDMGQLSYFLGIQAHYHSKGLFLNQHKYAEDLLITAGMTDCAPMPTPLPLQLNKVAGQAQQFDNPTLFRSLAGKLQYLTLTRPDIQFAVNYVCQKMHSPTLADFNLLKRIIRYIKGTLDYGISFTPDTDFTLRAYSDSDWAGCQDTRRSTGGFCTFLGTNIISWSAKRQPTVSRSSTEAEYRCLSDTAAEIIWLKDLLLNIGMPLSQAPELYCDNLSAVYLSANPALHKQSKHFATHYHYVREQVAEGTLIVHHIPGTHQLADIFTKSLPVQAFCDLRYKLGVTSPPTPSLREDVKDTQQNRDIGFTDPPKPIKDSNDKASLDSNDVKTMNILLVGFKEAGDVTATELFYHEMILTTLIHGSGVARNKIKARQLFDEIPKGGLTPDCGAYNALMSSLMKCGDVSGAIKVMKEMEEKGIEPDSVTLHSMFIGMMKSKEFGFNGVCEYYHKMKERCLVPKTPTVVRLMKLFCQNGEVNLGLDLWKYMLEKGYCPHGHALELLTTALCARRRGNDAFE
ncbi:Reverse transcriptase RNA-dependent DNA polymerase [Arabidopsis thaliana x Arabidopsis arenosa]|uniref:Reverse transcriptase RNA-dependent DNA polymerase n=1 Tax=Arabidopsis thaliana x Arabidopsis arenosa TaxID=1240361 RepID=A0A8T2C7X5_9BRAS|nr:Reverse transcriptase RNA-dependent DNA polymerase [Arabidopsis thaliana x Arabidopsis arenosa]